MVAQFCSDCGNLLNELSKDNLKCELCGKVARSISASILLRAWQMLITQILTDDAFSHTQTSVSKGFPSRLRNKINSYTQKLTNETLGFGPQIEMDCIKCPSREVTWSQAQLRSADEGSTIFYRCLRCGERSINRSFADPRAHSWQFAGGKKITNGVWMGRLNYRVYNATGVWSYVLRLAYAVFLCPACYLTCFRGDNDRAKRFRAHDMGRWTLEIKCEAKF
jgi:DNA-directed RNA polymerase I subunit RPA12